MGKGGKVCREASASIDDGLGHLDSVYPTGVSGVADFSNTSMGDNFEAGNLFPLVRTTQEQDWNQPQHFINGITLGSSLGTALVTSSGNSGRIGQTSGTLTSGN